MSDERIKISWDDMRDAGVDDVLAQQHAWARAARQTAPPVLPARPSGAGSGPAPGRTLASNAIWYLGLFGMAGALVAWLGGELAFAVYTDPLIEYQIACLQVQQVEEQVQRGQLSEAEGIQLVKSVEAAHQSNPYVQIRLNPQLDEESKEARVAERLSADQIARFLQQLIFLLIVAGVLGCFLAIAEPVMAQNGRAAIVNGTVGIAAGLCGGLLVGLLIDSLYHALGGGQSVELAQQVLARTVVFGTLGVFLSVGPGVVLRNPKRLGIGVVGGLIGGLIGGALFDPLSQLTGSVSLSRGIALLAIGGLAGAATGLLEQVVKTGWLQVTQGLIAGKQFVLYRNPTTIGSSPECEIYLFKDPQITPRHAAVTHIPGGFELTDLGSHSGTFVNGQAIRRSRLRSGDQVQIGGTCLTFQERAAANSPAH